MRDTIRLLRAISRVGVGLDNVDLAAARERGVEVRSTPDAVTDAAAELTGLVDATRRRLGFSPGEIVPVSYSGGIFAMPEVLDGFLAGIDALTASYRVSRPRYAPVIGAALVGSGVQASGMWPSPASKPDVASRPIQPAPMMTIQRGTVRRSAQAL